LPLKTLTPTIPPPPPPAVEVAVVTESALTVVVPSGVLISALEPI
jgi:hypothetical protein